MLAQFLEKNMSKMNLMLALNAYKDVNPTNNPAKSNFKWAVDLQGIDLSEPQSNSIRLNPGQSVSLFSGAVAISDDGTTTYDLAPKAGVGSTYVISHNGGQAPVFRVESATDADATTAVTVTKNGTLLTFTSTAGTPFDLIANGVVVGDEVRIAGAFNVANQGKFSVLSRTATSFTIENEAGQAEGPIVLGASFADIIRIYSSNGVQIGDKIKISSAFSSVIFGTYEITDVAPDYIEFYSLKTLPTQTAIQTQLQIFNNSKQFLYLESDKKISLVIDGAANGTVEPFSVGTALKPGMYLRHSPMYSASIKNESAEVACIFCASAE